MLRIVNVKKSFGGHEVLKDLAFDIGDRERVGLVGANGAGKSSLLKIIAGVMDADEGAIQVQGDASHEIAYLPQDAGIRSGRSLWDEMLSSFPELQQAQVELTALESKIGDAAASGDDDQLQEL
ncbi:MAG TPA: ATP-binding cassette domain-containing protein, partial [Chloroflexota bacterium]